MSSNSRKREREKQASAAAWESFLLNAKGPRGCTVTPLGTYQDESPFYQTLLGVMMGMTRKGKSKGPRTVIADVGMGLQEERNMGERLLVPTPGYFNEHIYSNPAFHRIEKEQSAKFGPYYEANWEQMEPKFAGYYRQYRSDVGALIASPSFQECIEIVAGELLSSAGGVLCPVPVEDAYACIPKNTFYGAPYYTSQWRTLPGVEEELLSKVRKLNMLDPDERRRYIDAPWVTFNRVVPGGEKASKVRVTMAPSKVGSLFEKQFTMPVLSAIANTRWGSGYKGNHICGPYVRYSVRTRENAFSMDYEAFDQTCGVDARNAVKRVLQIAFGHSWDEHLDMMFESFEAPSVITPTGVVRPGDGIDFGLGSGIGPTGVIGSLWNRLCFHYIWTKAQLQFSVRDVDHFGYGDDTLIVWNGEKVPLTWFEEQLAKLGMIINPSKQEYSSGEQRYASFLAKQYYYCNGVVSNGVYSLMRAWCRLLYKDVQGKQDDKWVVAAGSSLSPLGCDMLDAIALLEETKNHPNFKQLVECVRMNHPMRLKSSHYLTDSSISESGDKEGSGLLNFKSVQFILSLEAQGIGLTGREEEEWQRHVLHKFAVRTFETKGVILNGAQARVYLEGGRVEWTVEQLKVIQAFGQFRRTPLHERVRELVRRKGVALLPHQVDNLRRGEKITWTKEQVLAMSEFGNLPDAEKDMRVTEILSHGSIHEVVDHGPKFDFEEVWHSYILARS